MSENATTNPSQEPSRAGRPRRSLEEACSELDREIKVRVRCYDRWVAEGKLSSVDARDRLERLQSALGYLGRALDLEQANQDLAAMSAKEQA